jgi:hypothetical protein
MDSPNSGDAGFLAIVKRVRFGNARGVGLPLTLVTILFLSKSASQNGSQRCITSVRCPAPVSNNTRLCYYSPKGVSSSFREVCFATPDICQSRCKHRQSRLHLPHLLTPPKLALWFNDIAPLPDYRLLQDSSCTRRLLSRDCLNYHQLTEHAP